MKSVAFAILIVGIMHMKTENPASARALAALWLACVAGFIISLAL